MKTQARKYWCCSCLRIRRREVLKSVVYQSNLNKCKEVLRVCGAYASFPYHLGWHENIKDVFIVIINLMEKIFEGKFTINPLWIKTRWHDLHVSLSGSELINRQWKEASHSLLPDALCARRRQSALPLFSHPFSPIFLPQFYIAHDRYIVLAEDLMPLMLHCQSLLCL